MRSLGAILVSATVLTVDEQQLRYDLTRLSSTLADLANVRVEKISAYFCESEKILRCYFWGPGIEQCSRITLKKFEPACGKFTGLSAPNLAVIRLMPENAIAGAAFGCDAPFHYVVHTDVAADAENDFNNWYEQEHMPGLASVPGTVFAQRLLNLDAGPRYYACYDLCAENVLGCPEWLAVRGTAWSSRVRPMFKNTQRIMFKRIFESEM